MKMLPIRLPQGRWLGTLALATVLAFAAPLGAETPSPPCSDPEGVALNLMTQVFELTKTPEGRAALPGIISTIGGVASRFAPEAAIPILLSTGALSIGVTAYNAHNAAPPSLTQLHQDTRQFVQSLPPQQQFAFAQQLVEVARGYSALSLQAGPPGGICLEEPKFRVSPGVKERFRQRREALGSEGDSRQ